jgi:drug/metabolite transporter (DMT)-like permease
MPDLLDHTDVPTTAFPPERNRPLYGIFLKTLSALSFTCMSAVVKYAGMGGVTTQTPLGELVFFRSFFALVPVLLWLSYARPLSAAFRTRNLKGHIRRGLIGSMGMFCGFTALLYLPLPDATALSYAAPLLNVVLAWLILKEVIRLYRWSAVLIGFAGVIIMLLPHLDFSAAQAPGAWKGVVFALAGAVCSAFAMIEVRKLTSTEHTAAIVVYFSLTTTVLSLFTFVFGLIYPEYAWAWPTARDFGVLVLIGLLGGIGQILLTHCYRFADASIIAPFDYTSMIWALAIGWFVFGQLPAQLVLIGAGIVMASGIFVILRERALGIERKRQRRAGSSRPF